MAAVWSSCFLPLGDSYSICKVTQECASDTERVCDSIVLIINCLSLLFCDSGRLRRLQLFYKQEAGDIGRAFVLGGRRGYRSVLLGFNSSLLPPPNPTQATTDLLSIRLDWFAFAKYNWNHIA